MVCVCVSDLYEGMRTARVTDLEGIKQLLLPLEQSGILIKRTEEEVHTLIFTLFKLHFFLTLMFVTGLHVLQLLQALDSFIVVEREGHVIACGALFPFFEEKCGEIASIAVSPECRGQGQGDKLLGMEREIIFFHAVMFTRLQGLLLTTH